MWTWQVVAEAVGPGTLGFGSEPLGGFGPVPVGVVTARDSPIGLQRPYGFTINDFYGQLCLAALDGGGWYSLEQGPGFVAGVGAVTVMDNPIAPQRLYAFALGPTVDLTGTRQGLWVNYDISETAYLGPFEPLYPLSISRGVGVVTVMDNPNAGQRPYVFVTGSDGHLWVIYFEGGAWGWQDQSTPPGGASISGGVGVVTVMDNPNAGQRPYAFVTGSDGHLWVNWWDGSAWSWFDLGTPPGVSVTFGVGVVTVMNDLKAAQRPYAFVAGSDGHLWVRWWDGGGWLWGDQGTPPGLSHILSYQGGAVVTVMDNPNSEQRPYAFVTGSDAHLWVNWWDGSRWHWTDLGTPQGSAVGGYNGAVTVMDDLNALQRPYVYVFDSNTVGWLVSWKPPIPISPGS